MKAVVVKQESKPIYPTRSLGGAYGLLALLCDEEPAENNDTANAGSREGFKVFAGQGGWQV